MVFQAGDSLCFNQDIPCAPGRTLPVFQARHSMCSKQDNPCVPNKISLVLQASHLQCSKHDISCAPITKNAHATLWRIRPIVPGFVRIRIPLILGRSTEVAKKWHVNSQNFKRPKNHADNSDFEDFLDGIARVDPKLVF